MTNFSLLLLHSFLANLFGRILHFVHNCSSRREAEVKRCRWMWRSLQSWMCHVKRDLGFQVWRNSIQEYCTFLYASNLCPNASVNLHWTSPSRIDTYSTVYVVVTALPRRKHFIPWNTLSLRSVLRLDFVLLVYGNPSMFPLSWQLALSMHSQAVKRRSMQVHTCVWTEA